MIPFACFANLPALHLTPPLANLVHILADGTVAAWNPAPNGEVRTLVRSASTLYVGGLFTSIGNQNRNRIAALDVTTGQAVFTWNPNANGTVNTLFLNGSTLYMGGDFTQLGGPSGPSRTRLAALDLATGVPGPWNPVANSTVWALAMGGTRLYAGGAFGTVGGLPHAGLVALDPNSGAADAWNASANGIVTRSR